MAHPRRILRLQQLILETAATYIQRELEDPRIGLVSITRVKLSPDLTQARLYWSCLGEDADVRKTERGLQDALPAIQRAVAGALTTRITPRLELQHDEGMVHAQRMEEIFEQLRRERGEGTVDEEGAAAAEDADDAPQGGNPEAPEGSQG